VTAEPTVEEVLDNPKTTVLEALFKIDGERRKAVESLYAANKHIEYQERIIKELRQRLSSYELVRDLAKEATE
jgi:hypothetical protein